MSHKGRISEIDTQIAKLTKEKEELLALEAIPETERKIKHYLEATYSGRQLAQKHKDLMEAGMWEVRGEDPNPDLGGTHYQEKLGIIEGTLHDALKFAVNHKSFYAWGGGGDITKLIPIKVA